MKILSVTLVVHTDPAGATTEIKAADPGFREGGTYPVPELGPGLWTVTEVAAPSTNFVGGNSVTTTRVTVTPQSAADASVEGTGEGSGATRPPAAPNLNSRFKPKPDPRPIPKPTQRQRRNPK